MKPTPGPLDASTRPAWQRLMEPLARLAVPRPSPQEEAIDPGARAQDPGLFVPQAHRQRFAQAGLRGRSAPVAFYATKVALALGLPLLAWVGMSTLGRGPSDALGVGLLLGAALLGLHLPSLWLQRRIARRQRELLAAFPDAIDLVIVCIGAGLGLDAALQRSGRDSAMRSPALAEELELLAAELRLGVARPDALRHLAQRTGVEEIRSFATMLVQTERLGTGIADALRVHAQSMRLRRQRRAEEEAAQLPLKMLFPLIFALFPALLVVLMGPAVISLVRQIAPLVGGGA